MCSWRSPAGAVASWAWWTVRPQLVSRHRPTCSQGMTCCAPSATSSDRPAGLAFRWQADDGTYLCQRDRPASALAQVGYPACLGVHHDREVGIRPRWRLVTRRPAVVRVDRLGMDLDNPDQRPGRHSGTNVSLGLDRLAFRVRGENEAHPFDADEASTARLHYH